jgi:replicative DNA helicase
MIVVAARPGMGKTSIALNFIEAALFDKKREAAGKPSRTVLMFSLEMTKEDLMQRLLASKSRVNLRNIQKGFEYLFGHLGSRISSYLRTYYLARRATDNKYISLFKRRFIYYFRYRQTRFFI